MQVPVARIGSGAEVLTLTADYGAASPDELLTELRAETLSASTRVYALHFADLAEFFEGMATAWRG